MTRTWHLLSWPYLEKTQIVKKFKTYKKYKSNDRVTWGRIWFTWVNIDRDIDKNQFMFIRIYSLSELIIDSWPDKYLNYQPVFWPWPKWVGWVDINPRYSPLSTGQSICLDWRVLFKKLPKKPIVAWVFADGFSQVTLNKTPCYLL